MDNKGTQTTGTKIRKRSQWGDVWKRLRKNKSAVIGMIVFLIILIACYSAPLFYDYLEDVTSVNVLIARQGPSAEHPFGVDELGRDILARILWGGRVSLTIAIAAMIFAVLAGTILGTTAAYYGNFADSLIMRILDVIMAIPSLLLMITISAVVKPSTSNMIFAIGFGMIPGMSRTIRGQVLKVVDDEYIEAVRIQGASDLKIIVSHILPNAISPIITTLIMDIGLCVMTISTLSFLGLGVQPPMPEWGSMLSGGRPYLRNAWHIATIPGLALVLTLISLTLVGDGLRDALDPKMKR